ncbi:MAG: hypothetical protein FWF31_11855, partial [Desulfobulbus sp.]|nr:hypothetical protein [Desulfobulbus sp.]
WAWLPLDKEKTLLLKRHCTVGRFKQDAAAAKRIIATSSKIKYQSEQHRRLNKNRLFQQPAIRTVLA